MEHTNWKADIRSGCYIIYAGPKRECLSGASDDAIVYQAGRGKESNGPGTYRLLTDEQIANARLIAEAPKTKAQRDDLLAALKLVLLGRPARVVPGEWTISPTAIAATRAAIEKARAV